jgi:hypothetical protein
MNLLRSLTSFLAALASASTFAQAPSWLEETMFRSGKINVVVAVVAVVLVGLAVWMFAMDRKLRRMEERMKDR